jgi:hypothetical protein
MTFILTLDTKPPAAPALLIEGGVAVTGRRTVTVELSSADYLAGSRDVAEMKLWGDVEVGADPLVGAGEGDSFFQTYQPAYTIRLSAGAGRKTIYARLKDDVCNATVVFSDFIDLNLTVPVVTVVTPIDRAKISKTSPCDSAVFSWESSLDFDRYEVRVVPSVGSPQGAGAIIPMTAGSVHVAGDGQTWPADTALTTTIRGTDLATASPGDGDKKIKIFVRKAGTEVWSP